MLIIIPCGAKKAKTSALAWRLYQGPYFKACLRWALSVEVPSNVWILSAKYGLIRLDEAIEPYDLRMGEPGSVTIEHIKDQIDDGMLLSEKVIGLGGRAYTAVIKAIWPNADLPLRGIGGIGLQMQWLKQNHGKARSRKPA